MAEGRVRVGIGGWSYAPWKTSFYPKGTPARAELAYAATHLTSIEVNGTYYRSQTPATFRKWHDETPDDFVFALKAPRFATNRRVLAEAGESIERFLSSGITELGAKLGPINWQFADSKIFDAADFAAFLKHLPEKRDGIALRHALEVRHPSFDTPDFIAMARDHGMAIVEAGDSKFPRIAAATAGFAYLRIMGTTADHPHGYPPSGLEHWAERVREIATGKPERDVFLYVISGFKERNPAAAMRIIALA